jgi:PhoH-like ATPase
MGRDLGYLPGTLAEKMAPWIQPIRDSLSFLLGGDKRTIDMKFDDGTIEIEALTYIRGRSIPNAYMIVDECQNLSVPEMKAVVTRIGEGSKIVLTGDIEQIDGSRFDSRTNGLAYLIEKFKDLEVAGHITLLKGERSPLATLAANIL